MSTPGMATGASSGLAKTRSSLTRRYLLVFLVVALAPLLEVSFLVIKRQLDDGRAQTQAQLQTVALLQTRAIDQRVASLEAELRLALAAERGTIEQILRLPAEERDRLPDAQRRQPFDRAMADANGVDQLFLLSAAGEVVAGSHGLNIGEFRGNQAYFRSGLERASTQIQAQSYSSTSEGINAMLVSMPVHDAQGRVIGVLCMRARLDDLSALMLEPADLGRSAETFLVGENHVLLTATRNPDYAPGQAYIDTAAANRGLAAKDSGYLPDTSDHQGRAAVQAYRWLPALHVVLVASQEKREAYAPVYQAAAISAVLFLLAAAVAVSLALILSRRIARPITHLADTAARIAAGDLSLRAAATEQDELGQLGAAFNQMTERLTSTLVEQGTHIEHLQVTQESLLAKSRELESQTALLHAVIDNAPVGVVMKDARDSFRIAVYNKSAERILGVSPDRAIGGFTGDLWPLEQARHVAADDARVSQQRPALVEATEITRRLDDGRTIVLRAQKAVIVNPHDGRTDFLLNIFEDITGQKQFEQQIRELNAGLEQRVALRTAELAIANANLSASLTELTVAKEAADAANRSKSSFLTSMSHEIRTPLNAIVGFTHLLRRDTPTAVQDDRLKKIDVAAAHLLAVINDILDVSKIESGKLALEHEDFTLGAILDHVETLIEEAVRTKGLALVVDCEIAPLRLNGDVTRLRQALLNYASNAMKFTEKGRVTLRVLLLEDFGDSMMLRFEVADSGIGIAPHQLSMLFEAFEQADVSTTRRYGGTGLGLTITRRLAELMGGQAGCHSVLGEGSTFWFTARLNYGRGVVSDHVVPRLRAASLLDELRGRHAGARILLAEDNPVNRDVAIEMLQGSGLVIDAAVDGVVAVDMARETGYRLVLMDVQMPRRDGLEATRMLRALPGWADVPILGMTASAFDVDIRACLEAGMNATVAKPVIADELYGKLSKWLDSSVAVRVMTPATAAADRGESWRPPGLARFDGVPGLDVARGSTFVRVGPEAQDRILALFAKVHAHDAARLAEHAAAADLRSLAALAHELHGSAGNVGAVAVADAAFALEMVVSAGGTASAVEQHCQSLIDALAPLLEGIQAALKDAQATK